MKNFIEKLLAEWSYRTREGYPVITNEEHIRVLSEILNEWNLDEIKDELIQNLLAEEDEEEKRFNHSALNKTISYRNEDGETEEGLVGNLIRRPPEEDAYIRANAELDKLSDEDKQAAMDELGGEAQPERDIESERETPSDDEGEEQGEEEEGEEASNMFEPDTPSGDSYLDSIPDNDPAKQAVKDSDDETEKEESDDNIIKDE